MKPGMRRGGAILIDLTGAPAPRLRRVLEGFVQAPLEFRPMRAASFSVWAGESAERTITIVNNDTRALNIIGLEPKGTHTIGHGQRRFRDRHCAR